VISELGIRFSKEGSVHGGDKDTEESFGSQRNQHSCED
jgi:hypothetical protein